MHICFVGGFDTAQSISFVHEESKIVQNTQTCSNVLYLFVNETSMNSPIHRCIVTFIKIISPNDAIVAFGKLPSLSRAHIV